MMPWIRRSGWPLWAALAVPFVIAAIVLATRHWNPVLDMAMTELRVHDVGTSHTPLIGLPGRIGVSPDPNVFDLTHQGSHPGPLSFYLLAPTYRLLGAGAWALLAAMIVLNLAVVALVLWLARRIGGWKFAVAVAALLVFVVRGYGMLVVTQPWNPYLPLLCWIAVLLATAGVLNGDHRLVVAVVGAGSLCAQTHLPYAGLCGGLTAVSLAAIAWRGWREPGRRNELLGWVLRGLFVGLLVWSPVLYDQVRHSPGNLRTLIDYFRNPPETPVGGGEGIRLLLRHLDIVRVVRSAFGSDGFFVRDGYHLTGSVVPGVAFLLVWIAGFVVAARLGHRLLVALDATIAAALVLATVSMARIFGKVWYYLTLWMWSVTTLMAATLLWTAFVWLGTRAGAGGAGEDRRRQGRAVLAGVAALTAVASYVPLVVDAATVEAPEQYLSDRLRALVGPTSEALAAGVAPATGKDGTYLVSFADAMYFGSQAYGLVSELERRGFHVGMAPNWRVPITAHRTVEPTQATAEIRLVTGSYIQQYLDTPGAVEVALIEPRDDAELAEYRDLDQRLRTGLHDAGLDDLVALIDTNLFKVQLDQRLSAGLQAIVNRMLVLGQPEAVFLLPAGASG